MMKPLSCFALSLAIAGAALSCEPELAISKVSSNSFAVTLFSNSACDVGGLKLELGGLVASDQILPEYGLGRFTRNETAESGTTVTAFQSEIRERFLNTTLFTIVREDSALDLAAPKFIHADAVDSSGKSVTVLVTEANALADSSEATVDPEAMTEKRSVWIGDDFDASASFESRLTGTLLTGLRPLATSQSNSTTQTVCGSLPPVGWITTAVTGTCATVGLTSYTGRVIRRIDILPAGTSVDVCGDLPPTGWITTAVNGTCATVGLTSFTGRTIKRIDTLAAGTSVTICGDVHPTGWITTSVNGTCAKIGLTTFTGRTIKRIDTLAAGTSLTVCGDLPPTGWITTSVNSTCATMGLTTFTGRTIERIDTLPIGSTVGVCGDSAPSGWVAISRGGVCARIGLTTYNSSTIRRLN